jgi:hypothetical protein
VSGGGDGIFVGTQYNFVGHYVLMTDPSITRLEELRGKRIALDPTSPTYGYMLKVLEQVGLKKEDVSFGSAAREELLNRFRKIAARLSSIGSRGARSLLLDGVTHQSGVAINHVGEFAVGQGDEQSRDDA